MNNRGAQTHSHKRVLLMLYKSDQLICSLQLTTQVNLTRSGVRWLTQKDAQLRATRNLSVSKVKWKPQIAQVGELKKQDPSARLICFGYFNFTDWKIPFNTSITQVFRLPFISHILACSHFCYARVKSSLHFSAFLCLSSMVNIS